MSTMSRSQRCLLRGILLLVGTCVLVRASAFEEEGGWEWAPMMPSPSNGTMPPPQGNDDDALAATTLENSLYGMSTRGGLCVIGCTPYVNFDDKDSGIRKYRALVHDMARSCDVLVHVGDTKSGGMPCHKRFVTYSVHALRQFAAKYDRRALYAPGDNEICDCHRFGSHENPIDSDFVKAKDAREYIIEDLNLTKSLDLTGQYAVESHSLGNKKLNGKKYSCDFDKYLALDHYAVSTLEVLGSHWYLDDERKTGYPKQNEVDPLEDRLLMYLNARNCALDWIHQSAKKANATNKRALFFVCHASFYISGGQEAKGNSGIGDFWNAAKLKAETKKLTGEEIESPYIALFDTFTKVAYQYPELMIYVVHADAHRFSTVRMNPYMHNNADSLQSHHNLMLHQVEGDSRALTTFTRFTVDPRAFQPVTLKEEWSHRAFERVPYGHARKAY